MTNALLSTCVEVQVVSSQVPLQRPCEGSKLGNSITEHLILSAHFPLGNPFGVRVQIFRRVTCIDILTIVTLPFCSLMDNCVTLCKGVDCLRELGRMLWLTPIHCFTVCSEGCPFCEETWWLWLSIGNIRVSCMDKVLQAFFCSPSTNCHVIRRWHCILHTMLLISFLTNR